MKFYIVTNTQRINVYNEMKVNNGVYSFNTARSTFFVCAGYFVFPEPILNHTFFGGVHTHNAIICVMCCLPAISLHDFIITIIYHRSVRILVEINIGQIRFTLLCSNLFWYWQKSVEKTRFTEKGIKFFRLVWKVLK